MGTIELWDLPWVGRKGRPLPSRSRRPTGAGQGTSGPSSGGAQTDSGMGPWLSVLHVCGHRKGDEQDRYEEAVEKGPQRFRAGIAEAMSTQGMRRRSSFRAKVTISTPSRLPLSQAAKTPKITKPRAP